MRAGGALLDPADVQGSGVGEIRSYGWSQEALTPADGAGICAWAAEMIPYIDTSNGEACARFH
jgi:hypothetical protein